MSVLENNYKITIEWDDKQYIGIILDWDYRKQQVHLLMSGYVRKALIQFNHINKAKKWNTPFNSGPIKYGTKKQHAEQQSIVPLLDKKGIRFIQQVCGYYS